MVGIIFDYYLNQRSYLILKSKNLVKFCVHISPIFSCPVTYIIQAWKLTDPSEQEAKEASSN